MTETAEGPAQRFDVRDNQRLVTFLGWLLADADSQPGGAPRWTELALYRTVTGKYILEKIGRSDVFHAAACTRRSKGLRYETLTDALDEDERTDVVDLTTVFVPCDQCRPDVTAAPVFVERDISAVALYNDPQSLVDALYRKDSDNTRYLSRVSRELLDQAASRDSEIARVMSTPVDVT